MATTTATAVIGRTHRYGGITPTHLLFLTENDRPALRLYRIRPGGSLDRLATWFPTVENMLEDLVLMMGALTGAQPQIAEAVGPELNAVAGRLELQAISDARREQLYNVSRETPFDGKIVLTVLEDSTLIGQAARLRSFQVDCELCLSSRAHSVSSVTEAHRG